MNNLRKIVRDALAEGHYTGWRNIEEITTAFAAEEAEIAQKLAKHFKIGKMAPLGQGSQGFAYYIPNNKVLKITQDKSEVAEAHKIEGKKIKHLANIYGTYVLKGKYQGTYVIISELLNRNEKIDEAYELLRRFFDDEFGYGLSYLFEDYSNGSMSKDEIKDYTKRIKEYFEPSDSELTLWFFNGMLNIIDDVRRNRIQSTDWGTNNLGIKKDGTLAMYDMGYSGHDPEDSVPNIHLNEKQIKEYWSADEYPEFTDGQFNPTFHGRAYPPAMNMNTSPISETELDESKKGKKIANKDSEYILMKLGYPNVKYIGSGVNGDAYDIGDKVIKLTTDESEANLAHKFSGKNFKHIANVYKVSRYQYTPGSYIYIIILEKLRMFDEDENKLFQVYDMALSEYELFIGETGDDISFKDVIGNIAAPYLKHYFHKIRIYINSHKQEIINVYNQVKFAQKEIKAIMPKGSMDNLNDMHSGNVGMKPNGNIAFYDLRWWDFVGKKVTGIKTIKEIELTPDEINKKELPLKYNYMWGDFIKSKGAAVKEIMPNIGDEAINSNTDVLVKDLADNDPATYDEFAEWIYQSLHAKSTIG